jgi:hypothetical protein
MSAPGNLYSCPTCGASLSLEQLRGTDCPFCHTVFPHHGRAVEQAALVNQVMAQQMAQQGYYGAPPQAPAQYGAPPPAPYGANPYGQAPDPYGGFDPTAQVVRSVKRSLGITFVVLAFTVLFTVGIGVFAYFAR